MSGNEQSVSLRPPFPDYLLAVFAVLLGASSITVLLEMISLPSASIVTVLWLALYCLTGLRLMQLYGLVWISWFIRYRLLLFLLLVAGMVSVAWSIDPQLTLQRMIHLLGTTLVGFYLGYHFTLPQLVRMLVSVLALLLLASALAVYAIPDYGLQQYEGQVVWRGVTSDKNTLGFIAVMGIMLFAAEIPTARPLARMMLALALLLGLLVLGMSRSATSLLSLVAGTGVAAAFLVTRTFGLNGSRMVLLLLLSVMVLLLLLFGVDSTLLFALFDRSSDLTGRQEVWERVMGVVNDHAWTGTGYGTIWSPTLASEWQQQSLLGLSWTAHHAHNGFLQVASQLGLPVALLATLLALQLLIETLSIHIHTPFLPRVLPVVAFQIAFIISNVSEAHFLMDRSLFWMLEIALPVAALRCVEADYTIATGFTPLKTRGNNSLFTPQ